MANAWRHDLKARAIMAGRVMVAADVWDECGPLLASAPDLLAALKDLVEECALIGMTRGMAGQRVNAARAAIAKAQPKVSA